MKTSLPPDDRAPTPARSGLPARGRLRRPAGSRLPWAFAALAMLAATTAAFALAATDSTPTEPAPETAATASEGPTATAVFAGGCFWCMEKPFDQIDGVRSTTSGYTGGTLAHPTYEQVSSGNTGHVEAVRIEYDPTRVSYERLLDVYWRNVDPLDARGQFCDKGFQYTSAVFYADESQRQAAEASKRALEEKKQFPAPIVTRIEKAGPFYEAEDYHQDYYQKNPLRYRYYRFGCGRDARLEAVWGDEAGGASATHP